MPSDNDNNNANDGRLSNKDASAASAIAVTQPDEDEDPEAMTCSALFCLAESSQESQEDPEPSAKRRKSNDDFCSDSAAMKMSCCPKQLQLPMFLSKTYHMIDKCDPETATWSETGDNFVVKNVEKFATNVLPLYFKHSNFSSFARQLNFYGFRKLRTDPILTSEVDPGTACYVRFYHEHFQRNKPELLQLIKRATKGDQQSKDDLDSLRKEINSLKGMLRNTVTEYDRKLAELSYECNRRITSLVAEYDKMTAMVQGVMGNPTLNRFAATSLMHQGSMQPTQVYALGAQQPLQVPVNADLLHSLSQAAVTLQDNARANLLANTAIGATVAPVSNSGNVEPGAARAEPKDDKQEAVVDSAGV